MVDNYLKLYQELGQIGLLANKMIITYLEYETDDFINMIQPFLGQVYLDVKEIKTTRRHGGTRA